MKKLLLFIVTLITAITLVGCSGGTTESTSLFDTKDNVIGFSALSSVMTLHESTTTTTMKEDGLVPLVSHTNEDTFEILSEIEELTPYLELVTTFMGDGSNFEATIQASDLEDYEQMMIITTIDMEGEEVNYTLHYNEVIDMDDEVDEDDEDDEEADVDDEEDYDEYDSVLEGIMIIDEVTYTLYGEREVGENEESLELIANLDDLNYVTLDYEIENDGTEQETEFMYEVFVDNQLVKNIEIEFEQDNEETELSLRFFQGTRESEYDFEVETDGNTRTIEIEYTIIEDGNTIEEGEAEVTIVTNAETGKKTVRYEISTTEGDEITYDDEDEDDDDDGLSDEENQEETNTTA